MFNTINMKKTIKGMVYSLINIFLNDKKRMVLTMSEAEMEYGDVISRSFDSILVNLGYKMINKLYTGKNMLAKAYNPNGHMIYIINDISLNYNSKGMSNIKPTSDNIIPYSLKTGSLNVMNNSCYGILFESVNKSSSNITIVRFGSDLKPVEENFIVESGGDNDAGSVMVYPVISINDLMEDPKTILLNTEKNISNFRNSYLIEIQLEELTKFIDLIDMTRWKFMEFNEVREEVTEKLNTRILNLNRWNNGFLQSDQTEDEHNKVSSVVYKNLCRRNESATNLLRIIAKVIENQKLLQETIKNLDEATKYIRTTFRDIDKDLVQ